MARNSRKDLCQGQKWQGILEESRKAFGRLQFFVAGPPKNGVQFMVKDSKKYASTGGWGVAQFNDGKPADEAVHNTCFSCHEAVKARDFVFAGYAP
jgi:Cytochrome P460